MHDFSHLDSDLIRKLLDRQSGTTHDVPPLPGRDLYPAAVLIPFLWHEDEWQLLYIRRAEHPLDSHSGQVAFAGGKQESGDVDLHATALREAHEEIGIDPGDVTILGELGHHHSISHFQITPVVGHIPWPYPLKLQEDEVARAFPIPLSWLANPTNRRTELREFSPGRHFPVDFFDKYDGELLWGATARMTLSLLSHLQAD